MWLLLYFATIPVMAALAKRSHGPFFHFLMFSLVRNCLLFPLIGSGQRQAYSDILWYSDVVYFFVLGWAIGDRKGLIAGSTLGALLGLMLCLNHALFMSHPWAAWGFALTEIALEKWALIGFALIAALRSNLRSWGFVVDCLFAGILMHPSQLRPDNPLLIVVVIARMIALGLWFSGGENESSTVRTSFHEGQAGNRKPTRTITRIRLAS